MFVTERHAMRMIGGIVLILLGLVFAAYGSIGSLFVAAAVNKPGENVEWFDVGALIALALLGVGLVGLGIKMIVSWGGRLRGKRGKKGSGVVPNTGINNDSPLLAFPDRPYGVTET